jgi:hypothetical protein
VVERWIPNPSVAGSIPAVFKPFPRVSCESEKREEFDTLTIYMEKACNRRESNPGHLLGRQGS